MRAWFLAIAILAVSGCSVFGNSGVEIAPYSVVESIEASKIEIREYESMVLVSTPMDGDNRDGAFMRLFGYISGDNKGASKIAMTAPVFMDDEDAGVKIPMTAPVFMDGNEESDAAMMSFVMPADFTLESTPAPTDPEVSISEIKDYKVAVIQFNGRLSDANIKKHRVILESWMEENGYIAAGDVKTAGYNPPFTIPAMRRNEVLIAVAKK